MDRLGVLRSRTATMVDHLRVLVEAESFSEDVSALERCVEALEAQGRELLGAAPERVPSDGRTHLLWRFGAETRVLLVGHYDTVWPPGTIERLPFRVGESRATGPGCFDMKAGIVQGFHALSTIDALEGVTVLLTSDEELGSPTSAALIRELARAAGCALVLEPSAGGALKVGRKGVSMYSVDVEGRAAHAGLEPEKGANALIELAHQVLAIATLGDDAAGTTVTPTVATAGTATNVVPSHARIDVDVRATTIAEQDRVDAAINALTPQVPGTSVMVSGGPNRPPFERAAAEALYERALRAAAETGLSMPECVTVGGGSDGNFTAAEGCPTLDGLGPVGDGAHADSEHVIVSEMAPRAALVAALVESLLREGVR
jgi:glutamate carboxypeptidase